MKFTDVFIKRPVMGIALCTILVILGVFGLFKMNVSAYPELQQASVQVEVTQTGTSASSIQNYITSPLESNLAAINHLDYMESLSEQGKSTITLYFKPGTDVDNVFNDVIATVNRSKKSLPSTVDDPIVTKNRPLVINPLYLSFTSNTLNTAQLVDYLDRYIKPDFYSVDGVSDVKFYAPGLYLLITLDPEKIAKFRLSPAVVSRAIAANNLQISAGNLNSTYRVLTNNVDGTVKSVQQLSDLIVSHRGNQVIKLKDIAKVELESIKDVVSSQINGEQAVVMTFTVTPNANPLIVVDGLTKIYNERIKKILPSYINTDVIYDGTQAIRQSIPKVARTLVEAIVIVMFVMLLFLGSLKSLIVPVLAIPISIVANFFFLYSMGYTVNLVTLLAVILAIGLVVDDAIVVLENIHRHIKLGETSFRAAIIGTREIASPVIVMTFTLVVVFMPVSLSTGITGSIFKQFAFTLAGAVVISGFVSLVLSPMLVDKLYKNYDPSHVGKFEHIIEVTLKKTTNAYIKTLDFFLHQKKIAFLLMVTVACSLVILPRNITSELTPVEDKGVILAFARPAANSTLKYAELEQTYISPHLTNIPEVKELMTLIKPNEIIDILPLKDHRKRTQAEIVDAINANKIQTPGVSIQAINVPEVDVPGAGFYNFGLAIQSNTSYAELISKAQGLLNKALDDKILFYGFLDVNYNQAELDIKIDRDKAARFDVPIASIAQSLASYLSGGVAARVSIDGKVYKVITRLPDQDRDGTNSLLNYYVQNTKGINIPLSELITYKIKTQATGLPRINQQKSVTIRGISNKPAGDIVDWVDKTFKQDFGPTYNYTFTGDLRSYVQEGSQNNIIFALAGILIFLVLAIQFNSWRDGIVIMVTVPLAISGSLIALYWCNYYQILGATINLYTKLGLMTLIGLITKHGILMCEVAKEEQINHGKNRREAILSAARLRFRPILMTTLAMIAGLIPLMISTGTGANSRLSVSLVIVAGLAVGTCFTLFILPMIYTWIGQDHKPLPVFDETIKPIHDQVNDSMNNPDFDADDADHDHQN